ncbi:MAG: hypothetical protein ACJ73D_09455 [Pyrinomonadaceae bacterium]
MRTLLTRYWFKFDVDSRRSSPFGSLLSRGVGVTAFDLSDALNITNQLLFDGNVIQPSEIHENIDISTLEPLEVRPNMGVPIERGIWYPMMHFPYRDGREWPKK